MITDRQLRQYIAEALDPPRREEVQDALAASSALRTRLDMLLATPVDLPSDGWILPPPRVWAPNVLAGQVVPGQVMERDAEGGWLEVEFEVPPGREYDVVVVLERRHGRWDVLFPVSSDEVLRAGELPQVANGTRRLDVTVREQERVGVVLVPEPPDFSAPDPWEGVREAVAAGDLPVVTFGV